MRDSFTTIHTEGGLLPPDLLARIAAPNTTLAGVTPDAYHLSGERLNEAINRSWSRLLAAWSAFREASAKLPESDPGTSVTRERWLLVLFEALGYGRLPAAKATEIDGKTYAISHFWQKVPIHLLGCRVDLDRPAPRVAGAARTSPHGLVQEFLNRSGDGLWGFVSNGLQLRLLRDSASLTRQAYVEFDLEALMEGEVYPDFALLWLVCHQSRVESDRPEDSWLERWVSAAREEGTRALDTLRRGVEEAIQHLGSGFLAHPANVRLKERLRAGALSKEDYYRQLLRLVYRLIFLFVAEDRGLLLDPSADPAARKRYQDFYSTSRLRRLAIRRRGTRHADLYRMLGLVMNRLGSDDGSPPLALPALGSFLWSSAAVPDLAGAELSNEHLLAAIRALSITEQDRARRAIDYRNLGSEELGSIYESLLELHPELNPEAATFELRTAAGHERKTTGSYYTPSSLIQCLLDSALDPVLEEAARKPDPEKVILALKVCDPACGSGHFLIAAAHRIARRLASARSGGEEPSPEMVRAALRDVIGECVYGVDRNPMAVELCKVSLWMEAMEPGKPLAFLEHRILCGNSLLGATPRLLAEGIPDDAFKPIEGDDKAVVTSLRRQNRSEREGQIALPFAAESLPAYGGFGAAVEAVDSIGDDTIAAIHEKEARLRRLADSLEFQTAGLAADAWCAAFVSRKVKGASVVTHDVFLRLRRAPETTPVDLREEVVRLGKHYGFFHWHLAFPDVFRVPETARPENEEAGWSGGFDVVLGNPPWERIKLQEQEWFATRRPDIADAPNAAARKKLIEALATEDPALHAAFLDARREAEGESHFVRNSGRYPLCGRGDINTYAIFAETKRMLVSSNGRIGAIVPSGIATDDTTKFFFQSLMDHRSLVSLYDFQSGPGLFAEIGHARYKFCLLTLTGLASAASAGAEFAFFARRVEDLRDAERRFVLTAKDVALLNPNTRTCPVFRSRRDAEITKAIYRRVPVLVKEGPPVENPWGVSLVTMFHMSNDSGLFRARDQLMSEGWSIEGNVVRHERERFVPLYEAKMVHHFNHRFGDYRDQPSASENTSLPDVPSERLDDPDYAVLPRYWVPEAEVEERLRKRDRDGNIVWEWKRGWLFGWRDITNSTNERTVIATVLPRVGVGNSFPLMIVDDASAPLAFALAANLSSFVLDFASRSKVGGSHLNFFIYEQLPVLAPLAYHEAPPWHVDDSLADWLRARALELTYTTRDMAPLAVDLGYSGAPFHWDEQRRFAIRCELDAAFFRLYGISRDDADYILDTFPIVKRNDEARFGEFRTKRVILECFDAMQRAIETGEPYATIVHPPPADPSVAHGAARVAAAPAKASAVLPFERVARPQRDEKYREIIPLYSLKAAAGDFSGEQNPGFVDWVRPHSKQQLGRGMFIAQVDGRSMEPMIPDGSYCIFRRTPQGTRNGRIVLVECHDSPDPETGWRFTVKRYRSEKAAEANGTWRHSKIVLEPLNPDFKPIVLRDADEGALRVVAELVEVLGR